MNPLYRAADADPEMVRDQVKQAGPVGLPACPLMHGTGLYTQLIVRCPSAASVTLTSRHFDVDEMFDTIEREGVNQIAIVGGVRQAAGAGPGGEPRPRWNLASLFLVASSGVMWSEPVKQALLKQQLPT